MRWEGENAYFKELNFGGKIEPFYSEARMKCLKLMVVCSLRVHYDHHD